MNAKILWTKESALPNALYVDIFKYVRFSRFYRGATIEKFKRIPKQNNVSLKYRENGNAEWERNDYRKAIECYNKCLCFAEAESEQTSLAYANRAFCFLKLEMFQKCLLDIELAKKANYPKKLMPKLEKRRLECVRRLKTASTTGTKAKPMLSFPPDKIVPSMANVIKIVQNAEYGRHIVARCDIKEDRTVLVEEPMFKLLNTFEYRRCLVCLKENENLIPCTDCTSAMFCAGKCSENDFHKYECPMRHLQHFQGTTGLDVRNAVRFVMQSVIELLSQFSSVAEMIQFVEECVEDVRNDPQGIAITDGSPKSNFNTLMKLHYYSKFTAISGNDEYFALYAVNACIAYETLLNHAKFAEHFSTKSGQRFLMHLMTQILITFKANNTLLREFVSGDTASFLTGEAGFVDYGAGVFNIGCYFNHSCYPNVINVTNAKYSISKTIRPIKAGEQLCVKYSVSALVPTKVRRELLLKCIEFFCKCDLCLQNGPAKNRTVAIDTGFHALAIHTSPLFFDTGITSTELGRMKRKCYDFLTKFRNEPISEPMIMTQEKLRMIYAMQNV